MNEDSVILVVDDERDHADGIAESLENHCAKAIAVYNGKDALEIVRTEKVDIVITDLKLGDNIDGLDVLNDAKKHNPATEVVLITAYASIETCKDAIKRGAYDYLVKPIDIDQLRNVVKQICRKQPFKKAEPINNKKIITEQFIFEGIRGSDKAVNGIFEVLRRVAKTNISVLIEGDSGTGKELLARAVHKNSNRANKPFM
ncbi:MAG: sigma-54-dependent Fis family transcriptional regulator, partial [Planctomycetes bacterium]|nr:sigma-54-dependent Fis family transcriptional regulator [Planctomycetota bacterium]